ncbi:MAG: hypothetical protein ACYDH6_11415 [Acidimicrobiales bacterium]
MSDAPTDGEPDLATRLDRIAGELAGLPAQIDALGSSMTEIRVRLAGVGDVDDRLNRVEQLVTAIARELAQPKPAPTGPGDERLAAIEAAVAAVGDAFAPVATTIRATQDRVAMVVSSTEGLARAMDTFASRAEHHASETAAVTDAALTALTQRLDAATRAPRDDSALMTAVGDAVEAARAASAATAALGDGIVADHARSIDSLTTEVGARIDRLTAELDGRIAQFVSAMSDRLDALGPEVVGALTELPAALGDVVGDFADDVRRTASDAATSAGLAAAEASIAAAEAAGEAILTDQDARADALIDQITGAIDTSGARHADAVSSLRAALDGLRSTLSTELAPLPTALEELRTALTTALTTELATLPTALEEMRTALATELATLPTALEEARGDLATDVATAVVEAGRDEHQALMSAALASLDRAAMSAQANVERATDAALGALLAAVDARLEGATRAAVSDVTIEAIGTLIDGATTTIADEVRTATEGIRAPAPPAPAGPDVTELAEELERRTSDLVRASVAEAIEEAIEASIAPTLRSAGRAIADAAADAAAEAATEGAGRAVIDTDAIADNTAASLADAVASIEEIVRQALSVRALSSHRPPEGQEMTAAMMSAVAASLDEFALRVEGDLDRMGTRLAALAEVLEQLIEESAARRRNAGQGAVELLRVVASERAAARKPRRRSGGRAAR